MSPYDGPSSSGPSALEHDLQQYFPDLLKFGSTREMEASELYKKISPEVERISNAVVVEGLSAVPSSGSRSETTKYTHETTDRRAAISALAWNIERGIQLEGIIDALKDHDRLNGKDLLLLTELDYGMARSGNRFVAREIAEALGMNYAFAPVYIALQKGSGVEANVLPAKIRDSLHGLALLSKYPMPRRPHRAAAQWQGQDARKGKAARASSRVICRDRTSRRRVSCRHDPS